MIKIVKCGYCSMYIVKESGNLYIKDKNRESRPIKYAIYDASNDPIGLKQYMDIRGITIYEALKELEECNAVLSGYMFYIMFYDEEDVNLFVDKVG